MPETTLDIRWWASPDAPEPVRVEVIHETVATLQIRYRLLGKWVERRLTKRDNFICPNWENTRLVLVVRAEGFAVGHERRAAKAREIEARLRALTPPREAADA